MRVVLCLFLHTGAERLAIPAAAVVEVVPAVRLHPLPGGPPWVAGVFRFRGTVTPVVDLHRLATGEPCPMRLNTRIVVVNHTGPDGTKPLGLLSERVSDLRSLATTGQPYAPAVAGGGPELGPLVADAEGMVRLPDLGRLVPAAYRGVLFGAAAAVGE